MKKLLKICVISFVCLVVIVAVCIPLANIALKNTAIRNSLLHTAAVTLHGNMVADDLSLSFQRNNFILTSKNIKGDLFNKALIIQIPLIHLTVPYREILKGSFFPRTLNLFSPDITYSSLNETKKRKKKGVNWEESISNLLKKVVANKADIHITNGNFTLNSTKFSGVSIQTTPGNEITNMVVTTDIFFHNQNIPLHIDGYIDHLQKPLSYKLNINAKSIPLTLIPQNKDFFFSNGNVDVQAILKNGKKGMEIGGNIDVAELAMTVGWTSEDNTVHQEKPYAVEQCAIDFTGTLLGRKIDFTEIDLQAEKFHVLGSLLLDFSSFNNPLMDLRFITKEMDVKTLKELIPDPLISDWTTQTIFPRLENGKARITNFILAGSMDEIGSLNEPENAHCLAWSGILTNVDTFYNDHKSLGKVYTAHLAMDGDLLTIKNISGKSGKNLLTLANVSIANLYSEVSLLTADIDGSFELPWLKKIFASGVTGRELQQLVNPVVTVNGQVEGTVAFSLDILSDDVTLNSLTGKGAASGPVNLQIKDTFFPFNLKKNSFVLNYPGTSTLSGSGLWGKSPFTTKIDLIELDEKQRIQLTLTQSINDIGSIIPHNTNIDFLSQCINAVPIFADFTFTDDKLYAKGNINFKEIEVKQKCENLFERDIVSRSNFKLNFIKNVVNAQYFTIHTKSGDITFSGKFTVPSSGKSSLKNFSLKANSFPLQSLAVFFPDFLSSTYSGLLDADVMTTGPIDNDYWSSFTGFFNLKSWQGSFKNPKISLDNANIQGTFENGHIFIQGDDLRFRKFNAEYPLTFQADLYKDDLWKGILRLSGDYLDLTTSPSLFRKGKADLQKELPFDSLDIYAKAGHVRYRNLIFSPLLVQAKISRNKIIISKALIEHGNDLMWLTGSLAGKDVVYNSYFKLRETPVNPFLAMIGFESKSITGYLDMEGKLTARVTPGATIFETSKGPLSFVIKDGTLESSSSLVKILDLISLENIFSKQDVLAWKNSFKFDLIQGRFDLADGFFSTDSLIMDASAFDIFAQGTIDALHDKIDMKVKLAPFGTINKIFSSIPYLGYVLTGKSKSLFDYLLSVKGTIKDPDVQYLPLKGTLKSLSGYIKRLVSGRDKVSKDINKQLQKDIAEKNNFIRLMKKQLAPLHK